LIAVDRLPLTVRMMVKQWTC